MVRRISLSAGALLGTIGSLAAQFASLGADAYGQGNSVVAIPVHSSIYHNAAGMAGLPAGFMAAHVLQTVPLASFYTTGLHGVFSFREFHYGVSIDTFGDKYYRESRVGIAVARKQDKVMMGAKASYIGFLAEGAAPVRGAIGEVGMIVAPHPALGLGLRLEQAVTGRPTDGLEIPSQLSWGAAFYPSKQVVLTLQLDYAPQPIIRAGLRYRPRQELAFAAGVNPSMKSVHLGWEVSLGAYALAYGIASHPYVGMSQQATLFYKWHD